MVAHGSHLFEKLCSGPGYHEPLLVDSGQFSGQHREAEGFIGHRAQIGVLANPLSVLRCIAML